MATNQRSLYGGGREPLPAINFKGKRVLKPLELPDRAATPAGGFPLDRVLDNLDEEAVTEFLLRTQKSLQELQSWWRMADNKITFSHFWLAEMADERRHELLIMEGELLLEELKLPLADAIEDGEVTERDVKNLMRAVFSEYPAAFTEGDGSRCLDMITLLASREDMDEYRRFLAMIKCAPPNREYMEWLLAIRSFCVVSVITAIVNFYRQYEVSEVSAGFQRPGTSHGGRPATSSTPTRSRQVMQQRPVTAVGARTDVEAVDTLFQAAKDGRTDVVHYMLSRGAAPLAVCDGVGRTLLHVAVANNRVETVRFLLENTHLFDINQASDSGSTPLHVAVSVGNAEVVEMLLAGGADPLAPNTGLGDATAADMATEMGYESISTLLQQFASASLNDTEGIQ